MTSYVPAKQNSEFILYMGLVDQAARPTFKANPTLAAGDFKLSKDGGTLANLVVLPTVVGTSKLVKVRILGTEAGTAANLSVVASDAAGAEWDDVIINIQTVATSQIDDLATASTQTTINNYVQAILADTGTAGVQIASAQTVATVTTLTGHTPQTGDSFARLGAPAGASVSADILAIEAQTDDIGVAGAGLTAVPWNVAWDAEVQSEATDALNAYDPPTQAELVSEINDVQTDIAALNDPTAATIADAVWNEAKADHTVGTSFGDLAVDLDAVLTDTADMQPKLGTPAGISVSADGIAGAGLTAVPWNAAWDAEVESEVDDALGTGTGTALTAIPWNASWDTEVESEALDALNTILADSVPADGTIPTLRQALYMLTQFMMERSVSGTTVTVKKVDGSTSLLTLTLNDGTDPTSITRAT